jgi:hypothetical protein
MWGGRSTQERIVSDWCFTIKEWSELEKRRLCIRDFSAESAATTLDVPNEVCILHATIRGKAGQTSSVSLCGCFGCAIKSQIQATC